MIQIEDRKAAKFCRSDEEIFAEAKAKKDLGNEKFKAAQFKEAYRFYRESLETLDTIAAANSEHTDYKKTLFLNISVCCNKLGSFNETIATATRALDIDNKNAKAYFLRA